jgi:hypothetical protein
VSPLLPSFGWELRLEVGELFRTQVSRSTEAILDTQESWKAALIAEGLGCHVDPCGSRVGFASNPQRFTTALPLGQCHADTDCETPATASRTKAMTAPPTSRTETSVVVL